MKHVTEPFFLESDVLAPKKYFARNRITWKQSNIGTNLDL